MLHYFIEQNQLQEMEAKLQKKEEDLQDVTSKRKAELQHVCELESQVRQLQNFLCHNEGISVSIQVTEKPFTSK